MGSATIDLGPGKFSRPRNPARSGADQNAHFTCRERLRHAFFLAPKVSGTQVFPIRMAQAFCKRGACRWLRARIKAVATGRNEAHSRLSLLPPDRQLRPDCRTVRKLRSHHQKALPRPGEQRGHEEVLRASAREGT